MAVRPHGSEAYDLSLFEPKEDKIIELKPNKKLEKAQQRRARVQSFLNAAVTLAVAAAVISVVAVMITNRVKLTEMNSTIAAQKQQLQILQSEHERLTTDLAAKTSAQSVEDYADATGMQDVESGQIAYITVDEGEATPQPEPQEKNLLEKAGDAIANFFSQLAYLFD